MGTWNAGLFSNDITSDVKDTYTHFLEQQYSDEDAYNRTVEEYSELLGSDEEALFWYALADTQWNVGRLMNSVKENALKFIEEKGSAEHYNNSPKALEKWEMTLQKLKNKLESPVPMPKKYRKPIEFVHNPWNIGDIYAYQFHTDIATENGMYGHYILFQKVGDSKWYDGFEHSVVQVFDKVFETLPTSDEINDIRVLPLTFPKKVDSYNVNSDDYIPSFAHYLIARMIRYKKNHYPEKHLTYVGNLPVSVDCSLAGDFSENYWDKNGLDDWLINYYNAWQGVEY